MISLIEYKSNQYKIDLSRPLDISIPLRSTTDNVSAWYVGPPRFEPVQSGSWIGEVAKGGAVNFRNIFFNPHGHGTHTETVGHISKELNSINRLLKNYFFSATLISVSPLKNSYGDFVITKSHLEEKVKVEFAEALIIRTLPNDDSKCSRQYSHANPPYLHQEAALWIREKNFTHLLIDLPSVDREEDGGKLLAHRAFWNYPDKPRLDCTITELIYVPDEIPDGNYFLNLMVAPFENDAAPSKPVLYKIYS